MKTLVVFLFAISAFAQEAKVVVVDKADAVALKAKYEAYQKAKAEYEKSRELIERGIQYVCPESKEASKTMGGCIGCFKGSENMRHRDGFECGVEFTPDFRNAVPKPCPKTQWGSGSGIVFAQN